MLRPLLTKMRWADLGAAAAWQASIAKKGLGGDRGRPEEEIYSIAFIAHDRVIQRQFFGDPPTVVAAAIIEHALDFDGRYGVHTSPRVWLPCANLCIRRPLPHQDEAFLPPPCKILLVRPCFMAGLFLRGRRWWAIFAAARDIDCAPMNERTAVIDTGVSAFDLNGYEVRMSINPMQRASTYNLKSSLFF